MPLKRIFANSYMIHGKITLSLMLKKDSDVKLHNKCDINLDKYNFTNENNNNDVESSSLVIKWVHLHLSSVNSWPTVILPVAFQYYNQRCLLMIHHLPHLTYWTGNSLLEWSKHYFGYQAIYSTLTPWGRLFILAHLAICQ